MHSRISKLLFSSAVTISSNIPKQFKSFAVKKLIYPHLTKATPYISSNLQYNKLYCVSSFKNETIGKNPIMIGSKCNKISCQIICRYMCTCGARKNNTSVNNSSSVSDSDSDNDSSSVSDSDNDSSSVSDSDNVNDNDNDSVNVNVNVNDNGNDSVNVNDNSSDSVNVNDNDSVNSDGNTSSNSDGNTSSNSDGNGNSDGNSNGIIGAVIEMLATVGVVWLVMWFLFVGLIICAVFEIVITILEWCGW